MSTELHFYYRSTTKQDADYIDYGSNSSKWERPDTYTEHELLEIRLSKLSDTLRSVSCFDYRTENTPLDLKAGDIVHVVYAVYSTGDSFGLDSKMCLEILSVHKDIAVALENCDAAYKTDDHIVRGEAEKMRLVIKQDDGTSYELKGYAIPWNGYFESLDYVEIWTTNVQG